MTVYCCIIPPLVYPKTSNILYIGFIWSEGLIVSIYLHLCPENVNVQLGNPLLASNIFLTPKIQSHHLFFFFVSSSLSHRLYSQWLMRRRRISLAVYSHTPSSPVTRVRKHVGDPRICGQDKEAIWPSQNNSSLFKYFKWWLWRCHFITVSPSPRRQKSRPSKPHPFQGC